MSEQGQFSSRWRLVFGASVLLLLGPLGCEKHPPTPSASPATSTAGQPAVASASAAAKPIEKLTPYKSAGRVVAVGDVHGDLAGVRQALRLGGAIDAHDHWSGGNLVVVQTGDILDRGDDEKAIIDLFERLEKEAPKAGGAFYALNGNHETMNVTGDLRYPSPAGMRAFLQTKPPAGWEQAILEFPAEQQGRAAAFMPGGVYAKRLSTRPIVIQVDDTVFVHGGVLPEHLEYGLNRMNREVSDWMRGSGKEPVYITKHDNSPLWTRRYSLSDPKPEDCATLHQVLTTMGAKRMVVGHTPQKAGITSACNQEVWRIDSGLSAYYGSVIQAVEITKDQVKILGEINADAGAAPSERKK